MRISNYLYQAPNYGEEHILSCSFSVEMPEDVGGALMKNHPVIQLLPFLYEYDLSRVSFRRFIFDRRGFEVALNEVYLRNPVSDTEFIRNNIDPDLLPQYTELMYVYYDTLYVRQKLYDLLFKIYQIGLGCGTYSFDEPDRKLIMPSYPAPEAPEFKPILTHEFCKSKATPIPQNPKPEVFLPTIENPVRGFTYEKVENDETGELGVNGLENAMFGVKLSKAHPYKYNKQYMDYRVYSETNSDKTNTFCINLPENVSENNLTDPNCQILYHIIPVLALAPTEELYEAAVINTVNRGLEFVGVQPDGTLISYGPVNVPIIMGDVDQPRGVYIPTDTPEPMKMVFRGIMNKVEERLGHALSAADND